MIYRLFVVVGVVLLLAPDASARRRRPKGQCMGRLSPKVLERPGARIARAYWMFGVPSLQQKRVRGSFSEYIVFLDIWDDNAFSKLREPLIKTEGAGFSPPLLIIPRRSDSETIQFWNVDRFKHHLTSQDKSEFKNLVLPPNAREKVKVESILPIPKGRFKTYRLRSRNFKTMRAEIVMLRSSAYTQPDARGRFRLRGLPKGEHTLRVYHRGKIVLERKIEIGRRRLNLKTLKLRKAD